MSRIVDLVLLFFLSPPMAPARESSAYAGKELREIKALSPAEEQDLLNGKGMGFAKAAELNHFPGPLHVLALADSLRLTPAQRNRTEAIRAVVQRDAKAFGRALVDKERELDRLFSSGKIDATELRLLLHEIGRLQADLRNVHLKAHVEQRALLSPEQIAAYDALRGYTSHDTAPESCPNGHP